MFSQTVEYALRAMVYLASRPNEAVSSEVIARATRVPPGYLSKVLRELASARLIGSQRGPSGGFILRSDPDHVSILSIITAVDPIQRITRCPLGNPDHVKLCPLHARLDGAIKAVEDTLARTTLGEILGEARTDRRCQILINGRSTSR